MYADILVETGIAYKMIPDEVKSTVAPKYSKEEQMNRRKKMDKKNNTDFKTKICHHYENQNPEKLDYIYTNVIEAIVDITKHDLKIALGEEKYKGELEAEYLQTKIEPIRELLEERGISKDNINDELRNQIIEELIAKKKENIEQSIASKMAIEYIGGMTDITINALLMQEGKISMESVIKKYDRPEPGKGEVDSGVRALKEIFGKTLGYIDPHDEGLRNKLDERGL